MTNSIACSHNLLAPTFECDKHKKICEALHEIIESGKQPTIKNVLQKARLHNYFFSKNQTQWKIDIRELIKINNSIWLKNNANNYQKTKSILDDIVAEGGKPTQIEICRRLGHKEYLTGSTEQQAWKKKILILIKTEQKKWDRSKKAFIEAKKLLNEIAKEDQPPTIKSLCERMKRNKNCVYELTKVWQKKLFVLMKEKQAEWNEHGCTDFQEAKKALNDVMGEGYRPNSSNVARKLGKTNSYFVPSRTKTQVWKQKIIALIKQEQSKWDYAKQDLHDSSIDSNTVYIKHIVEDGLTLKEIYKKFIQKVAKVEDYKKIGIKLKHVYAPLPLSYMMYSKRKKSKPLIYTDLIDPLSFSPERIILLQALIKKLYNEAKSEKTMDASIRTVSRFIGFLDENELNMPTTPNDAREAYIHYSHFLRHQTSTSSARRYQPEIKEYLCILYPNEVTQVNIFRGIRSITEKRKNTTSVTIDDASYALSYYYHYFHKISDILLEDLPFPQLITLNAIKVLVTPYRREHTIPEDFKHKLQNPWIYYDLNNCRLRQKNEIDKIIPSFSKDWEKIQSYQQKSKISATKETLKKYEKQIALANTDKHHPVRVELAERAMRAFYMLLSGLSGMKDSELCNIEWGEDDNFVPIKSNSVGIVTIKPRANYKEIESTISRVGIYALRKALKIRRILLQGKNCNKLFFKGYGNNISTEGSMASGNFGQFCIKMHSKINPKVNGIGTRKLKVFKNKLILKQTGGNLWLTSTLVGNTEKVNAEYYISDTKDEKNNQLYNFVNLMVRTTKEGPKATTKSSSSNSNCTNYENPEPFIEGQTLNCSNIFACFFCKNYGIEPNKDDIHKLMSLLYIIRRIETGRSFSNEQFNKVIKPAENIINIIFKVMSKKYDAGHIINEIQILVFVKSILHPYWEFKLSYLYDIGAF